MCKTIEICNRARINIMLANARAQNLDVKLLFTYRHWIEVGVRERFCFGALHLDSLELIVAKNYGCFAFCSVLCVKSECAMIPN